MERIDNDSKLFNASKKRFAGAKETLRINPLRLVMSKSHERRIADGNLVGESIENQALLESHDAIIIRCFSGGRIVFLESWRTQALWLAEQRGRKEKRP